MNEDVAFALHDFLNVVVRLLDDVSNILLEVIFHFYAQVHELLWGKLLEVKNFLPFFYLRVRRFHFVD